MESQIERLKKASDEIDILMDTITDVEQEIEVVKDGIIDIPKYCNSKYKHKIMWVLKDTNDADGGYDMRVGLLNRIKTTHKLDARHTFEPIIRTTYGILNDYDTIKGLKLNDNPSIADVVEHIAFVNVKKLPGGGKCNANDLQKDYNKYGYIVRKQIVEYEPDIIIFGGTDYLLTSDLGLSLDFEKDLSGVKYWIKNGKLYIRAYHPAQFGDPVEYGDEIIKVVRVWENQNK